MKIKPNNSIQSNSSDGWLKRHYYIKHPWSITNIFFETERMTHSNYSTVHELFSRKGFTFWLEKPTNKQSSCSCSVTYLTMSAQALDTGKRWLDASRLNWIMGEKCLLFSSPLREKKFHHTWSTIDRCCCKFVAMRSITAVSDKPIVMDFVEILRNWINFDE